MKFAESDTPESNKPEIYTVNHRYYKLALASLLPFLSNDGQNKKELRKNAKLSPEELEKKETRRLEDTFGASFITVAESFLSVWSELVIDEEGSLTCANEQVLPTIFRHLEWLRRRTSKYGLEPIVTVVLVPEPMKPKTLTNAFKVEAANRSELLQVYQQSINVPTSKIS